MAGNDSRLDGSDHDSDCVAKDDATGDVTLILSRIQQGESQATQQLLPLVYDELRKLAAAKMAHEKPGHTLQATALVHEAYIRLVDDDQARHWQSRGHFFSAAAEAMRRILVDAARQRQSLRRGGEWRQVELTESHHPLGLPADNVLCVDEALTKLAADEPTAAELAKLRYFAGLPLTDAADALGISRATASRYWAYAKSFLLCELQDPDDA